MYLDNHGFPIRTVDEIKEFIKEQRAKLAWRNALLKGVDFGNFRKTAVDHSAGLASVGPHYDEKSVYVQSDD